MLRSEEEVIGINKKQRQVFDELYYRFLEPQPPDVLERLRRGVRAADLTPGDTVLDVGTGVGVLIPLIQPYRPGHIVVCDLSGRMLEQVARLYPGVERHQCDVRDLKLPAASIDVVFMNAVFGNLADKEGAMRNTVRMLRPGGRVVISHPEGRKFVEELSRSAPFPIEPYPSRQGFADLFSSVGLTLTHYEEEEKLILAIGTKPGMFSAKRKVMGALSANPLGGRQMLPKAKREYCAAWWLGGDLLAALCYSFL